MGRMHGRFFFSLTQQQKVLPFNIFPKKKKTILYANNVSRILFDLLLFESDDLIF